MQKYRDNEKIEKENKVCIYTNRNIKHYFHDFGLFSGFYNLSTKRKYQRNFVFVVLLEIWEKKNEINENNGAKRVN